MKISIASYAFHGLLAEGKMDIFGYLESTKFRYRLDAADIWNGTLQGHTDEDYLRKVKEAMAEKEMTLANLCVDGAHLWDPDAEVRERLHQNALAHLRAAVILGALTVRIDIGGQANAMSAEQFDVVVKRYREYAQFAADHGFRVGPENHFGPALVPENMAKVQQAVNSPAYGILLHLGHWVDNREEEGDRLCAPWTMHTHVDARTVTTRLYSAMRLLREANYQGYWGVEHHSAHNEYSEVDWQLAEVRRTVVRLETE